MSQNSRTASAHHPPGNRQAGPDPVAQDDGPATPAPAWTAADAAELARLEAVFDAGGRGVELADQIDALRARRDLLALASGHRLIAHFSPQAWMRGQATEVDPEGTQDWDCTAYALERPEYLAEMTDRHGGDLDDIMGVLDGDDQFTHDPAAPDWVRDWHGPFDVRITREPASDQAAPEAQDRAGGPAISPAAQQRAAEETFNDRYAAWDEADKPAHPWRPLVPGAISCWQCGHPKACPHHPALRPPAPGFAGIAGRDAKIVTLQCELLDHTGHVRPGLPPHRRTDLEARINRLRTANGWPHLDMRGR